MTKSPASSHALVGTQFLSIGVCVFPFVPQSQPNWFMLIVSLIGVALGIYTVMHNRIGNFAIYPEPMEGAKLITSGPYRWVRHPMYLSLLLIMLGIVLLNNILWNYLGMLFLIIAILGKMQREEAYLMNHFNEYSDYFTRTKRLIPFLY